MGVQSPPYLDVRHQASGARKSTLTDLLREFPVICLEFPVLQKNFPDSLHRELFEKSLRHSGFMLSTCRLEARNRDFPYKIPCLQGI